MPLLGSRRRARRCAGGRRGARQRGAGRLRAGAARAQPPPSGRARRPVAARGPGAAARGARAMRCCSAARTRCPRTCRRCSRPWPRIAWCRSRGRRRATRWPSRSCTRCPWTERMRGADAHAPVDAVERFGDRMAHAGADAAARARSRCRCASRARRIYVLPTALRPVLRGAAAGDAGRRLNYNNNPALLLGCCWPAPGWPAWSRAHLQLSGMQRGSRSQADPVAAGAAAAGASHAATARPTRVRRGLQVDDDGASDAHGRARTSTATTARCNWRCPRSAAAGSSCRSCASRPRCAARPGAGLGLGCGRRRRCWSIRRPNRRRRRCPRRRRRRFSARLHPHGDDVHHLRDYRAGDTPRRSRGRPRRAATRCWCANTNSRWRADVLLDWQRDRRPARYEQRIRRLARWVDRSRARAAAATRLLLPGQRRPGRRPRPEHRHACLRALALLPHG